jgi:nucleotide-binding universal stress UspA family protein
MIKDLIVNLSTSDAEDPAGDYAISLAREFDAHVSAVAFAYEAIPIGTLGDGAPEFIDELMKEAEENATTAIAKFEAATRGSGVSAEARWMSTSFAGTADTFGLMARRFDLSVLAQVNPEEKTPQPLIVEAALFDSGRPVVLVPYIQRSGVKLDRILVGWDGSRSAARAVADALPLLHKAKEVAVVEVIEADANRSEAHARVDDVAAWLGRHGILAFGRVLHAIEEKQQIEQIWQYGADFIVAGAYGHTRLGEWVFGGFTQSLMTRSRHCSFVAH